MVQQACMSVAFLPSCPKEIPAFQTPRQTSTACYRMTRSGRASLWWLTFLKGAFVLACSPKQKENLQPAALSLHEWPPTTRRKKILDFFIFFLLYQFAYFIFFLYKKSTGPFIYNSNNILRSSIWKFFRSSFVPTVVRARSCFFSWSFKIRCSTVFPIMNRFTNT